MSPTGNSRHGLINAEGAIGKERAGVINLFQTTLSLNAWIRGRASKKRSVDASSEGLRQHDYPTFREPLGHLLDESALGGETSSICESDVSNLSFLLGGSNGLTFGRQSIQINETGVEKTG